MLFIMTCHVRMPYILWIQRVFLSREKISVCASQADDVFFRSCRKLHRRLYQERSQTSLRTTKDFTPTTASIIPLGMSENFATATVVKSVTTGFTLRRMVVPASGVMQLLVHHPCMCEWMCIFDVAVENRLPVRTELGRGKIKPHSF